MHDVEKINNEAEKSRWGVRGGGGGVTRHWHPRRLKEEERELEKLNQGAGQLL